MQFGIFYEHQLPQPWYEDAEYRLIQEALVQVELADQIGIEYVWEVEHHFLEEYSHSSAPEVFLAACSQRTRRIKLGHGIVLMPPPYNHPARVAERIAMLDLVSGGRVQWGTGKSSSRIEIEGFAIDLEGRHAMWIEAVRETARMMCSRPYAGYQGQYFTMPSRNVVPKPVQKPHPPLWVACSNRETIKEAARLGMGALCFAFVDAEDARRWVEEYYTTFKNECQPIGQAVNPNIAMVAGFMCHAEAAVAVERGLEGFQFFGYALSHYYFHGFHRPGQFDLWADFQRNRPPQRAPTGCIGNPAQVRAHLEMLEAAGVDQVIFIQQAGNNQQTDILESLQIFGEELLPAFQQRERERAQHKAVELAPYIAQAMARIPPLHTPEVELVAAYPVLARQQAAQVNESSDGEATDSMQELVENALSPAPAVLSPQPRIQQIAQSIAG
jgi:alkanesulfonate monooxygenase SsuD/methylene tetrahydromethanopterin reductase-like flavin-dependent oxidoreductase (luciferase family)